MHELEGEESQVLGPQVCTGRPEVHREEVPGLDRRGDGTVGGHLAVASFVEMQAAIEEQNPCRGQVAAVTQSIQGNESYANKRYNW